MTPEVVEREKRKFNKIIAKIRVNPQKGLEIFYKEYGKMIYLTALAISRSTCMAEEIVGDILVKIWKLAPTIENIDNPRGWLCIITSNLVKDYFRKKKDDQLLVDVIPSKENPIEEYVSNCAFYEMIRNLSPEEQDVIICKLVWRFKFQEIAERNGQPLATVSSIYYRAIEKLSKTSKKF